MYQHTKPNVEFSKIRKTQKEVKKTTKYKTKKTGNKKNEVFDIRNLIISLNLLP